MQDTDKPPHPTEKTVWVTRGGYEIAAGPIERPFGCMSYVVLND